MQDNALNWDEQLKHFQMGSEADSFFLFSVYAFLWSEWSEKKERNKANHMKKHKSSIIKS